MVDLMKQRLPDFIDTPQVKRRRWLTDIWQDVWRLQHPGWDFEEEEPSTDDNPHYCLTKEVGCLSILPDQPNDATAQAFLVWFADNSRLTAERSVLRMHDIWTLMKVYGQLFKSHVDAVIQSIKPETTPGSPLYISYYKIGLKSGFESLPKSEQDSLGKIAKRWTREGPSWEVKQK